MFKKAILIISLISMMFVIGCKSKDNTPNIPQQPTTTNMIQQVDFNQEHYIWESFLYPTNRTTGK